jgi:hypothetical protein
MRLVPALCGLAALAFSTAAIAAPVSVAPVSFSPEFQTEVDEDLGTREGEYLRRIVTRAVERALVREGASLSGSAGVSVDVVIVDADPNRPTLQQISNEPGLSQGMSVSIGGAELRATLRDGEGNVISEVRHRRYNRNITDGNIGTSTWAEAHRSINQFAAKVADAYTANMQ